MPREALAQKWKEKKCFVWIKDLCKFIDWSGQESGHVLYRGQSSLHLKLRLDKREKKRSDSFPVQLLKDHAALKIKPSAELTPENMTEYSLLTREGLEGQLKSSF